MYKHVRSISFLVVFLWSICFLPASIKNKVREHAILSYDAFWKNATEPRSVGLTREELLNENYRLREELKAYRNMEKVLPTKLNAVSAPVIFRDLSSMTHYCWVRAGERTNQELKERIVAKNSPVVVGDMLVGVIKHVGTHASRVMLITDKKCVPSVQAIRGENEMGRGEIFGKGLFLSKGKRESLQGFGFGVEGIAEDDLLITSGLDGLFPRGLKVGIVTKVSTPREGACSYEIEAESVILDLNKVLEVAILPPLIEDGEDLLSEFSW